jgi:chemotaxis protein MotA
MWSLIVGVAVVGFSVFSSMKSGGSMVYLQGGAIAIVMGGTIGVLLMLTPGEVLKSLFQSIVKLAVPEPPVSAFHQELNLLGRKKPLAQPSRNPIIQYASELYEQGVDSNLFEELIFQKVHEVESRAVDAIQSLKALSKYPPALGMVGTVMGMIGLFAELESAKDSIGAHLSVAMTATFYGLILSNAVIGPLADRLEINLSRTSRANQTILDIILLINRNEPLSIIEDELYARVS